METDVFSTLSVKLWMTSEWNCFWQPIEHFSTWKTTANGQDNIQCVTAKYTVFAPVPNGAELKSYRVYALRKCVYC